MRAPRLYLAPTVIWLDREHRVQVDTCTDCFAALHGAGFYRVGAPISGEQLYPDRCDVCRVSRYKGLRDPWRVKYRREWIAALLLK
jgi:cytochrome c